MMSEGPEPVGDAVRGGADDDAGEQRRWQRDVLERLLFASLREQRRARRWSILLRLLTFVWIVAALALAGGWFVPDKSISSGRHTALIEIKGVLAPDGEAAADDIIGALQSAFDDRNTAAVVLRMNSPGGSPVQAGAIYDEIRRLRTKHPQTHLYAVVEDVCASGGYYVAAAADRIYVDKASLVGSIGVLIDGFGFEDAMQRLGIERRLLTAGENKGFLDPFSPMTSRQRDYARNMLGEIHRQFIDAVRTGRGERLRESAELFSGLVWTGERSIELGLADAYGTVDSVARDVIQVEEIVDFSPRRNVLERLTQRFGAAAGEAVGRVLAAQGWQPRLR